MKAFIDYYRKNAISPVSQDISNLEKHYRRRDSLYRALGLAPGLLAGKDVLEFGPGSGYNSIHTLSLHPRNYVLVDGNNVGLERAKELLGNQSGLEFHLSLIEEYADNRLYDVVLCEGLLPVQNNPEKVLSRVASFVKPGGVLVITCHDPVSILSDCIRRAIGRAVRKPDLPVLEQAALLEPLFRSHFVNLPGMSRPITDWVLDNVLQPFPNDRLYTLPDAINRLDAEFRVYGASPDFFNDWRWYKDNYAKGGGYNSHIGVAYKENLHNFLDFRVVYKPRSACDNEELLRLATQVQKRCWNALDLIDSSVLCEIAEDIDHIAENILRIGDEARITVEALRDAAKALRKLSALPGGDGDVDFGEFKKLFGRGQQYISFVRDR